VGQLREQLHGGCDDPFRLEPELALAAPRAEPTRKRSSCSVLAMAHQVQEAAAQLYRLRLITADPLSLRNRTVCDLPCKTTLITPEIPYSLL
jgi:hypothetical protein